MARRTPCAAGPEISRPFDIRRHVAKGGFFVEAAEELFPVDVERCDPWRNESRRDPSELGRSEIRRIQLRLRPAEESSRCSPGTVAMCMSESRAHRFRMRFSRSVSAGILSSTRLVVALSWRNSFTIGECLSRFYLSCLCHSFSPFVLYRLSGLGFGSLARFFRGCTSNPSPRP